MKISATVDILKQAFSIPMDSSVIKTEKFMREPSTMGKDTWASIPIMIIVIILECLKMIFLTEQVLLSGRITQNMKGTGKMESNRVEGSKYRQVGSSSRGYGRMVVGRSGFDIDFIYI